MSSISQNACPPKSFSPPSSTTGHAIAALTGYEDPDTQAWDQACVQALERLVQRPHGALASADPQRVLRGLDLARSGAVQDADHDWEVAGASGTYTWRQDGGKCPCPDSRRYYPALCKHMIAVLVQQEALRTQEPLGAAPAPAPVTPLCQDIADKVAMAMPCPEALFSLCLRGKIDGTDAQLTGRGQSVAEFTRNVAAVRGFFDGPQGPAPAAAAPPPTEESHFCTFHGLLKPSKKAPGTWYCTGKCPDGSYCKTRWPS